MVSLPCPPSSSLWTLRGAVIRPPRLQLPTAAFSALQATISAWQLPRSCTASHEYRASVPWKGSRPGRASSGRLLSVLFISNMPVICGQPSWLVLA